MQNRPADTLARYGAGPYVLLYGDGSAARIKNTGVANLANGADLASTIQEAIRLAGGSSTCHPEIRQLSNLGVLKYDVPGGRNGMARSRVGRRGGQ